MKNKKILGIPAALFIVGLLVVGGATAALVDYLSNTVTATGDVESPIELNDGNAEFSIDIDHSGEYDTALIKITNKADVPVYGNFEITHADSDGWHTAVSEDINYCFKGEGTMDNVENCKTDYVAWLTDNSDWMDWVADSEYSDSKYEAGYVMDHNGDSFTNLGYTNDALVMPIDESAPIPAGETLYAVAYFDTELNVNTGGYIIEAKLTPASSN